MGLMKLKSVLQRKHHFGKEEAHRIGKKLTSYATDGIYNLEFIFILQQVLCQSEQMKFAEMMRNDAAWKQGGETLIPCW